MPADADVRVIVDSLVLEVVQTAVRTLVMFRVVVTAEEAAVVISANTFLLCISYQISCLSIGGRQLILLFKIK